MARYRVLARSYIGRLVEPGDVVDWDGVAGSNLEKLGTQRRSRRKPDPPPAGNETHPADATPIGDRGDA